MQCELCQHEAVGACKACGTGFCADHAAPFCFRCATAIIAVERSPSSTSVVADDRPPRYSGKGYLQCTARSRPTIHVEDPGPPACYRCQALARRVCRNCQGLFCPEHAAGDELCDLCARSSRLGLVVLGAMLLLMAALLLLTWWSGGQ
jgi:hypothetical protein